MAFEFASTSGHFCSDSFTSIPAYFIMSEALCILAEFYSWLGIISLTHLFSILAFLEIPPGCLLSFLGKLTSKNWIAGNHLPC
jgi:hypothetical protein